MPMNRFRRLASAAVLASATMIVTAQPAMAQPIVLPAGEACEGFDVALEGTEGNQKTHKLRNKNGNPVTLVTGTSGSVVFTNISTGKTFTLRSRGTAIRTTPITTTPETDDFNVQVSGHFVLILFPSDVPKGPSSTLFEGRVDWTDTGSTDTLLDARGKQTDICAELAS